jgi:hypothetical protein
MLRRPQLHLGDLVLLVVIERDDLFRRFVLVRAGAGDPPDLHVKR